MNVGISVRRCVLDITDLGLDPEDIFFANTDEPPDSITAVRPTVIS